MRYGSICSGIEAASLAWEHLGWKPAFFAEVEPFPSAVLMHRWDATRPLRPLDPDAATTPKDRKTRESWVKATAAFPEGGTVPNLGDFTKIQPTDYEGNIDLLVGGCPCQSYSLAGLRKGLADPRGNLTLEFAKLAFRTNPRWIVYENVPGVLSCNSGADFAAYLSLLCGWDVPVPKGGWRKAGIVSAAPGCYGLAWRILDSQYTRVAAFPHAVPQRRRRILLVGYSGSWEPAAKVLFDGDLRGGDTPPRRAKGQNPTPTSEGGFGAPVTLRMREGKEGGGKGPLLNEGLSLTLATHNDQVVWWDGGERADTITCTSDNQRMPDCKRLQCVIEPPRECMDMRRCEVTKDIAPTLESTDYKGGKTTLAFVKNDVTTVSRRDTEVAPPTRADALTAVAIAENIIGRQPHTGGNGPGATVELAHTQNATGVMGVAHCGSVRRLLPVECERLMAVPDNYTRIPWKGKPAEECPDAPRYKALGNSMVVSVMMWIGERIAKVDKELNAN